jgi:hypothetical protein
MGFIIGGYLANWFLDNVLSDRFASGDTCPVSPEGSYLNFLPSVLFPIPLEVKK